MGARLLAGALVFSGAATFAAMGLVEQGCAKTAPPPSARPPIVFGVSLALTPPPATRGSALRNAITAAAGEINAGGGLLGRQIELDIQDDRTDQGDFAVGIAKGFVAQDVAAVIGPMGSGQVKAVADIYRGAQTIELSPTATSVELTTLQDSSNRFFFRTTPADDFQGAAVILLATRSPGGLGDAGASTTCNDLALAYLDNAYGSSMAGVVRTNFPKRGSPGQRKVVIEKKIPVDLQASYASDVASIVAAQPDCLALITNTDSGTKYVHDLKADPGYAALEAKGFFIIGSDGMFTQGFLDNSLKDRSNPASDSTAVGVYGTDPDTRPGTAEYNAFKTIYDSYFPLGDATDVPAFAANAFDAMVLVALAIEKAGSATDRLAIRDALKEVSKAPGRPIGPADLGEGLAEIRNGEDIDYAGASGNVDLDDNGNVTGGFIVWEATRDTPSSPVTYKTLAHFTTDELAAQVK